MQFKDIKQNHPVYILDTQEFKFTQGRVANVSVPRIDMNRSTGKTEMVVDVTIESGGKTQTYAIPESLSVTYAGSTVLSTDKAGLASEVEALRTNAEQALAAAEKAKAVLEKSASLLSELSPDFRNRQETEERFGKIEGSIERMEGLMKKQQEMIEKFIKKLE